MLGSSIQSAQGSWWQQSPQSAIDINGQNLTDVANITPDSSDARDIGSTSAEIQSIYMGDSGRMYFGLGQTLSIFRSSSNSLAIEAVNSGTAESPVAAGVVLGSSGNYVGTQVVFTTTTGTIPTSSFLNETCYYRTQDVTTNWERLNWISSIADPANGGWRVGMEKGGTGDFRDLKWAREELSGKEVFLNMECSTGNDSVAIGLVYAHLRWDIASMGGVGSTYFMGRSGATTLDINVPTGATITHDINGSPILNHGAGAFAFQENTTISSTGTLTIDAFTTGGDVTNPNNIVFSATNKAIYAPGSDDAYTMGFARDNGVGWTEVWRMQGADDPYFSMGGSQQFKFYNSGSASFGGYLGLFKTDSDSAVEGDLWYDDSENVLKYFNGTVVKTIANV